MRVVLALLLTCALSFDVAGAQTPQPQTPALEGVRVGEPLAGVVARLGDPLWARRVDRSHAIWRFLTANGANDLDVMATPDNLVYSVTVVARLAGSSYADPYGATFGMSQSDVRAKLGKPFHEAKNADDGSVDLWYDRGEAGGWIYEFHSGKLDFVQVLAPRGLPAQSSPGPPVVFHDGSSQERAVVVLASGLVASSKWIDTYLTQNVCGAGNDGHWEKTDFELVPSADGKNPLAHQIVQATCTSGGAKRQFFFNTPNALNAPASPTPAA